LARIWRSDLHFAAHGCIQPHLRLTGKITKASHSRRSQGLICGFREWGGWDSNPGPADYESSQPVPAVRVADLGRYATPRSCWDRFGHVFGMIKVTACPGCGLWSQIHGLGANLVVPGLEGAPRDDLDSAAHPGVPQDPEPSRRDQERRRPARNPRAGLDRCLGEPLPWRPSRTLRSDEPCASARCRGSPRAGGAALPWSARHRSPFDAIATHMGDASMRPYAAHRTRCCCLGFALSGCPLPTLDHMTIGKSQFGRWSV